MHTFTKVVLPLMISFALGFAAPANTRASQRNWIDRYIATHGHCMQQPNGPFTTLNPMEKPIEDWTDQDLVFLKEALGRCDALPESVTGISRLWTGQLYERYVSLVHEQQERAARKKDAEIAAQERAEQEEATRQRQLDAEKQAEVARVEALKRANARQLAERKDAEERAVAMAEELKAASRLAEETEARARAVRAEAQARVNVEAAKQRAAAAEAQIRNAEAQARVEREKSDQQFAEAHPEGFAAETAPQKQTPTVYLKVRNFGCANADLYLSTLAAVALNDAEQAKRLTRLGIENGSCVPLQPGPYAMIQDKNEVVCIAPVGSTSACQWVAASIITK